MKTLLFTVGGDDDFQALMFEESSVICAEDLAKMRYIDMDDESILDEFNHIVIDDVGYEESIPCTLQVIEGTIPREFVEYIRDEVQEYDSTKSKQFYLFEVE